MISIFMQQLFSNLEQNEIFLNVKLVVQLSCILM
jgi:hypothetical protein